MHPSGDRFRPEFNGSPRAPGIRPADGTSESLEPSTKVAPGTVCPTRPDSDEPTRGEMDPPRSRRSGALILLTAPAVVAGVGSTVVTVPVNKWLAAFFGFTVVLSAVNELRKERRIEQRRAAGLPDAEPEPARSDHGSFRAFVLENLRAPGLCARVQAGAFLTGAALQLLSREPNWIDASCFAAFAIGASAGANMADKDYRPPVRQPLWFERASKAVWDGVWYNLKIVLKDPGAMFCLGNVALNLHDCRWGEIFRNPGVGTAFVVGLALAVAGLARGFAPLLTGRHVEPSGNASFLGGVGDIFLGGSMLALGNVWKGAATIIWGDSNILYGWINKSSILKRLTTMTTRP